MIKNARLFHVLKYIFLAMLLSLRFNVADAQQAQPDYLLHPGDTLDIAVWMEPEMTKTVLVRPDGKIAFPLVGELIAGGRTVAQVRMDIEARLKTYIPEPVVTVSINDIKGNTVYVIGQVSKPGAYIMNPRLNVLQILSLAGGTTPYAAVNDIMVIRREGASQKVFPFKYGEVSKGRALDQNILLDGGDVVVVP